MRVLNYLIPAGLLLVAGCFTDSFTSKESVAQKPLKDAAAQMSRPHNYITPDQVDEKNFRDKEKLLRRELELDEEDAGRAAIPGKK
jgi:hypothetical protein